MAEAIAGMESVKLAFPVLGRTDVAANVEVADLKALTEFMMELRTVEGIAASETLIGLEV